MRKNDLLAMAAVEAINDNTPDNMHASLYSNENGELILHFEDDDNENNNFDVPVNIFLSLI